MMTHSDHGKGKRDAGAPLYTKEKNVNEYHSQKPRHVGSGGDVPGPKWGKVKFSGIVAIFVIGLLAASAANLYSAWQSRETILEMRASFERVDAGLGKVSNGLAELSDQLDKMNQSLRVQKTGAR